LEVVLCKRNPADARAGDARGRKKDREAILIPIDYH
jgi:hypothetical protein